MFWLSRSRMVEAEKHIGSCGEPACHLPGDLYLWNKLTSYCSSDSLTESNPLLHHELIIFHGNIYRKWLARSSTLNVPSLPAVLVVLAMLWPSTFSHSTRKSSLDLHRERENPDDNKKHLGAVNSLTLEEFMEDLIKGLKADQDVISAGSGIPLVKKWDDAFREQFNGAADKYQPK